MGWTRTWMSVAAEGERDRACLPRLEPSGYAAWGPSFYVWEEDPRQGRRWAAELSRPPASKDRRVT